MDQMDEDDKEDLNLDLAADFTGLRDSEITGSNVGFSNAIKMEEVDEDKKDIKIDLMADLAHVVGYATKMEEPEIEDEDDDKDKKDIKIELMADVAHEKTDSVAGHGDAALKLEASAVKEEADIKPCTCTSHERSESDWDYNSENTDCRTIKVEPYVRPGTSEDTPEFESENTDFKVEPYVRPGNSEDTPEFESENTDFKVEPYVRPGASEDGPEFESENTDFRPMKVESGVRSGTSEDKTEYDQDSESENKDFRTIKVEPDIRAGSSKGGTQLDCEWDSESESKYLRTIKEESDIQPGSSTSKDRTDDDSRARNWSIQDGELLQSVKKEEDLSDNEMEMFNDSGDEIAAPSGGNGSETAMTSSGSKSKFF
jgi:hypothetical protein